MKNDKYERFTPSLTIGLTSDQVEKRKKEKLVNKTLRKTTKTYWEIIRDNVFTFFNILLTAIAILEIYANHVQDIVAFMAVMLANMVIGLIQDIRAKKLVEKLKIAVEPNVEVIRDGKKQQIPTSELVLDDIFYLETGKQVSVDGIVKEGTLEVDESIITGESLNVKKKVGDIICSGSFVVSGRAIVLADKVGKNSFAEQIQAKAKQFKRPKSELLKSINWIFRIIAMVIIPIGVVLFFTNHGQQIGDGQDALNEAISHTSAAMIGMIPSGMFLFTSMTLAVGVLRLGKKHTMVQELYSIEMLARSNVVCFDKTGTLTDGTMRVVEIINLSNDKDIKFILGNLLNATKDNNQSARAIIKECPLSDELNVKTIIPFSSERKYSAVSFEKEGTYILGAIDFIGVNISNEIENKITKLALDGNRVLALAHSKNAIKDDVLPSNNKLIALIVIADNVRSSARDTIAWFKNNEVDIKIISGDDPITVSTIAKKCGVEDYDNFINLDGVSLEDVKEMAMKYTIFGRVSPEQKAAIVEALKDNNKTVAMTGDGVNDIIALKRADCSIAMASGADATKCSAHLVLMDSDFSHMPEIVQEGRRVVNNLQQTCSLYLTKTIFAFLVTFIFVIGSLILGKGGQFNYPFQTQHLYIWEFLGIGLSSFFLSLQPNDSLIKSGFVKNVLCKALPGGVSIALAIILIFVLKTNGVFNEDVATTMGMIAMSTLCFVVLLRCCLPFNKYRLTLYLSLVSLAIAGYSLISVLCANGLFPINFFETFPEQLSGINALELIAVIIVFSGVYFGLDYIINRQRKGELK
ncbi:MAG: HAD-IC family P-type ATPase [Erysipelotrichales bacterium]|nr:HAD-IC family P-type ATPase [Erysipelotrichales bacterium]